MRIGILGSGNMGRTLGGAWAVAGHTVFFGSRNAEKGRSLAVAIGHGTSGGTNQEAAEYGDVLFQTVRSLPTEFLSNPRVLAGKLLIDCNNRSISDDFQFGPPPIPSFAEQVAMSVPGVRVVKALNTMAQEVFNHPPEVLRQYSIACFLAGDDRGGKATASQLVEEIGLTAIDCGSLSHSWMLETAGDLIRYVIIHEQKGPYATFAVPILPPANMQFGGRQDSSYH